VGLKEASLCYGGGGGCFSDYYQVECQIRESSAARKTGSVGREFAARSLRSRFQGGERGKGWCLVSVIWG
jgi:hypothetical protein